MANNYDLFDRKKVRVTFVSGKGKSILKSLKIDEWEVVCRKKDDLILSGVRIEHDPMILLCFGDPDDIENYRWIKESGDDDFKVIGNLPEW